MQISIESVAGGDKSLIYKCNSIIFITVHTEFNLFAGEKGTVVLNAGVF